MRYNSAFEIHLKLLLSISEKTYLKSIYNYVTCRYKWYSMYCNPACKTSKNCNMNLYILSTIFETHFLEIQQELLTIEKYIFNLLTKNSVTVSALALSSSNICCLRLAPNLYNVIQIQKKLFSNISKNMKDCL